MTTAVSLGRTSARDDDGQGWAFDVRPLTIADAPHLAALHAAAFASGWSEADFGGWLAKAPCFGLLAVVGGEAAAFVLALIAGDDAEILTLATRPDARRHGAGTMLVRALGAAAFKRGAGRVVLEVAENNLAARGLYAAEGFVEIGRRSGYYLEPKGPVDALVLAQSLAP